MNAQLFHRGGGREEREGKEGGKGGFHKRKGKKRGKTEGKVDALSDTNIPKFWSQPREEKRKKKGEKKKRKPFTQKKRRRADRPFHPRNFSSSCIPTNQKKRKKKGEGKGKDLKKKKKKLNCALIKAPVTKENEKEKSRGVWGEEKAPTSPFSLVKEESSEKRREREEKTMKEEKKQKERRHIPHCANIPWAQRRKERGGRGKKEK